jgi:TonB family protein
MSDNLARVLKIGLVQDGMLVEDRLLGKREGLTVGREPGATLSLPQQANLPRRHALIEHSPQGYKLNLLPDMKGRLLIDDRMVEIARLVEQGKARQTEGGGVEVLLKPNYKGKITVGDSTILFQLVPPPLPAAPLTLPKEIRGGILRNIDLAFMVILVCSALAHTGMVLYLQNLPIGEEEVMAVATEQFVSSLKEEDFIVQEEKTDEGKQPEQPGKKGGGGARGGGDKGVENKGIIPLLTRASGQSGAVADLLNGSGLGNSLKDALGSITGVKVGGPGESTGIGGTRGSGTGGPGSGSGTGIGDIGSIGSGGTTGTGNRAERKITAKLATAGGGVTGKIDAEKVRGYIRSQLGGVRHCYEMQLNVDRNLQGKVKVLFSIDSSGAVASCSITENSMGNTLVADCVCRRVERWRFPPPDEGTVTVSYTFIFTPAE